VPEKGRIFKCGAQEKRKCYLLREKDFENLRMKTNHRASHINDFFRPNESTSSMNEKNEKQKIEVEMRKKNRFPNQFFIGNNQKYNKYLRDSPEQKEFPYYW
jgi:hypothetical protein